MSLGFDAISALPFATAQTAGDVQVNVVRNQLSISIGNPAITADSITEIPDPNRLTLDLDPDNEFIWNKDSLNKINEKFNELIKERAGKDLDDYELRKIGSEIEGLIKFLLQNGQLSYNPDCRVMNYSMGLPKTNEVL